MATGSCVSTESILSLPTLTDSIETLSTKLSSYRHAVGRGMSLAAVTGYRALPEGRPSMISRIREEMKPAERDAFDDWKVDRLTNLPAMDWDIHRGDTPQSKRGLKKAIRISKALNFLYQTDRAEACHYKWILEHHGPWLPLFKAVARILVADKHAQALRRPAHTTSDDFSQLVTLDNIIKTSTPILQRSSKGSDRKVVAAQLAYFQDQRGELRQKIESVNHTGKRKRQDEPQTLCLALQQRKKVVD